ncbi:MAG: carbohydrate kinase family protein [Candidatus Diapherotrites archaeon]
MLDVVCIGNAAEDVFIHIHPRMFRGEVMLTPGKKIEIENMEVFTGGGGTNCAVGFSRFGMKTALVAEIGQDDSGNAIMQELKAEGVSRKFIIRSKKYGTAYSAILTGFGDRIILTYKGATAHLGDDRKIKWGKIADAEWFYISSLHNKPTLVRKAVSFAAKNDVKVAWNPGKVEIALGLKRLAPVLKNVDVLIVNEEEAALLAKGKGTIKNLEKIRKFCRGIVVITAGRGKVHAFDGKKIYTGRPFKVKVLDTTGAGDSFNCAFISALAYGRKIPDAIEWGCANAASVIQELGTKNILLSRNGIVKFIRKNKNKRHS